jgi:hypothetical protein
MKTKLFFFHPVLFCFLLMLLVSNTASALTRVVVTNSSQCPPDPVINPCYTLLSAAVTDAVAGDSIEIRRGTYATSNITINKGLSIYGIETAATILEGGGSPSAILTLDAIVSGAIAIRNLTFSNASTGIEIRNTTSAQIKNNIFELGAGSTAVRAINSASSTVANNTFFQNGTGIASDTITLNIVNNLFYQASGGTAITPATMELPSIRNNLFFQGSVGPTGVLLVTTSPIASDPVASNPQWQGNISVLDPLFVDTTPTNVAQRDFHLEAGTPCQDTGNTSEGADSVDATRADIGAYGGSNSDTIPIRVSGITSSVTTTTPATVTLTWAANTAYTVKGYNIHYGYASGVYDGTDAIVSGATKTSPIDAGNATTTTFVVSRSSVTTAAPVLNNNPPPLNGSLKLSWSQVAGATGYNIYYSLASAPTLTFPAISLSGGTTTAYTLSGLTNGELYNIAVTAVTQAIYYFAVTAYDTSSTTGTPGVAHESNHSAEKAVPVGSVAESGPSNVVTGMPEPITPLPDLPNTGCFVATAAYGSPLAPSVLVLREFRDRFLVTNAPGRAFVRWYYTNSPAAARYLVEHPSLKPLAQAALAPVVAAALFFTRTSPVFQTAILIALAFLAAALFRRNGARIPSKETPR